MSLLKKVRQLQERWHKPVQKHWDVLFMSGSMEACSKVFDMVIDIGDPVMALSILAKLIREEIEIENDERRRKIISKIWELCYYFENHMRKEKKMREEERSAYLFIYVYFKELPFAQYFVVSILKTQQIKIIRWCAHC